MLNSRAIAIQGFAFSPITIAVQGLIAQLDEEQQRYGGGGRGHTFGAYPLAKRRRIYTEADELRLVQEKYEALEKARKRDAKPAEIKAEPAKETAAQVKKIEAVPLAPLESPFEAQAMVQRQAAIEEEQVMALMCQLMLED